MVLFASEACKSWASSFILVRLSFLHDIVASDYMMKDGHSRGYGSECWHWSVALFTEAPRLIQQRQRRCWFATRSTMQKPVKTMSTLVLACLSEAPTFARTTTKTLTYLRWPATEAFVTTIKEEIRSRGLKATTDGDNDNDWYWWIHWWCKHQPLTKAEGRIRFLLVSGDENFAG